MVPGKPAKSARFARRLHNALGIWALALILMWAITAVYFSFPDPFEWTIDYFDEDLTDGERPGDEFVRTLVNLHFGRSWGMAVKLAWVALGLLPAVLFVTGCITWWVRVVRRRGAGAAIADRTGDLAPLACRRERSELRRKPPLRSTKTAAHHALLDCSERVNARPNGARSLAAGAGDSRLS